MVLGMFPANTGRQALSLRTQVGVPDVGRLTSGGTRVRLWFGPVSHGVPPGAQAGVGWATACPSP
eukprot:7220335-Heterocapsa_arctica.AAC.1